MQAVDDRIGSMNITLQPETNVADVHDYLATTFCPEIITIACDHALRRRCKHLEARDIVSAVEERFGMWLPV